MPEIDITLTADELRRLQQAAALVGKTVEQLAADELRARYALGSTAGKVVLLRHVPRKDQGINHD